jgi:catechol 2,3-dioxygenase-like lactoylglutathione lyase family enzyme
MLSSPHHVIIGTQNISAQISFWTALGYEVLAGPAELSADASAALFGSSGPVTEAVLGVPGTASGLVRLVTVDRPQPASGPFDCRPSAIDIYSTDQAASMALATDAGFPLDGRMDLPLGPGVTLKNREHLGPDGTRVTFVAIERRRPSILDAEPDRLHSEIHSLVTIVDDIDQAAAPFIAAGLVNHSSFGFESAALSELMHLPRTVAVKMNLLGDAALTPLRLEFLALACEPGEGSPVSNWPLAAGLPIPAFVVSTEFSDVMSIMSEHGVEFGSVVFGGGGATEAVRSVRGVGPGNVSFVLSHA